MNAKVADVANTIAEKFKVSYETLRTVSLLPGVRKIEKAGEVLGEDTIGSIQQLYNSTFLNISLSEIYVLPKDFDHQRINPVTKKNEEPLAIFDELIADSTAKTSNASTVTEAAAAEEENALEEVEEFEYALHKEQLTYFSQHFSQNNSFDKFNVPLIAGPEVITCDNSDFTKEDLNKNNNDPRKGIVFTVPKYGSQGNLNGGVSAVLRTKVIGKYLPEAYYGLINRKYQSKIIRNPDESWSESNSFFTNKQPNPNLIFSKVIGLKTADINPWELWVAMPDSLFYQFENYKKAKTFFYFELAVLFFLVAVMFRTTYKNFQQSFSAKEISRTLGESASKLSTSAKELSKASEDLSASTKEQAASSDQVASALEEITQMAHRSTENVESLSSISNENLNAAIRSRENMQELAKALNAIQSSEELILKQVNQNGEQLNKILGFINDIKEKTKLIDDIVFQTKLLSFNASVEAARAGEQGKGFAVVAEEVGKLASMSGAASVEIGDMLNSGLGQITTLIKENADEINKLVSESTKNLENGSLLSQESIKILNTMTSLSEEVRGKVDDTQRAIQEQRLGLVEIGKSSHTFQESTQENKAKCDQTSEIASALVSYSENINQVIVDLNKLMNNK